MNITKNGFKANVAVTNSSALPADCAYKATKTEGIFGDQEVERSLSVGPNSTGNISDMGFPAPGISYDTTVTCTATYNGNQVTIGEAAQKVSG